MVFGLSSNDLMLGVFVAFRRKIILIFFCKRVKCEFSSLSFFLFIPQMDTLLAYKGTVKLLFSDLGEWFFYSF